MVECIAPRTLDVKLFDYLRTSPFRPLDEFRLDQYGDLLQPDHIQIRGIGATKELIEKYDLFADDVIEKPERLKIAENRIMRQSFMPKNADADPVWQEMAGAIINSPHWKHLLKNKGTKR